MEGPKRTSIIILSEKFQNYILSKISVSLIPQKLKTYLKSNLGYINYKGKYVLLLELEFIDGPSFYDGKELYIRNGPNLNKVEISSDEITVVNRRCFINNWDNYIIH